MIAPMRCLHLGYRGSGLAVAWILWLAACATGGAAVAIGPCAIASGGPGIINVSPTIKASVGDKAIEAADKALQAYLKSISGPIGGEQIVHAKNRSISEAEKARNKQLTTDEKAELENKVEEAIRANCRGLAK